MFAWKTNPETIELLKEYLELQEGLPDSGFVDIKHPAIIGEAFMKYLK